MGKSTFKCWNPEDSDQASARVQKYEDWMDEEEAATEYADIYFHDWECPDSFEVHVVRCDGQGVATGKVRKFHLDVEYTHQFNTEEIEDEDRPVST